MTNYLKENKAVVKGFEFIATLQLRTPLRVLIRHGEIHTDINTEPPKIAEEEWEGIWVLKTKTYRELGINISEMNPGTHASDIGPILPGDYIPFLITIRKIIELDIPVEDRIKKLRKLTTNDKWKFFIKRHGGIMKIIKYFFK